jgi:hypothetical protein
MAVATGTVVMASVSPAFAVVNCTSDKTGYIPDSVVVPPGATCTLSNATVTGSVLVKPTGILHVFNSSLNGSTVSADTPGGLFIRNTYIAGNVTINKLTPEESYGEPAFFSDALCGSTLAGSLTFQYSAPGSTFTVGTGFPAPGEFREGDICSSPNTIRGSVAFYYNQGRFQFGGNTVSGSVRASNNTGGGAINNNTIGGSLVCSSNNPAVTKFNNHVSGATVCSPPAP